MWRRLYVTILILVIPMFYALPMRAQQKPFTQEQVSNMVRAGLGEDSGAKLIVQRGIDFAPAEDFLQTLKAAGASEPFLAALRAAKPPEPATSAKKPINQVQAFRGPTTWLTQITPYVGFALTVLLSGLVSLVVAVLLGEQLTNLFARLFGGFVSRPHRKIGGVWYSVFWFRSVQGDLEAKQNLVHIRVLGDRFFGDTVAGDDHRIRFYGSTAADMFATGKWEHKAAVNIYHGSFQFILDPEGEALHGRWIGFNKKQTVATGPWILIKVSTQTDKTTLADLRNRCSQGGRVYFNLVPKITSNTLLAIIQQQKKRDTAARWSDTDTQALLKVTATGSCD